MFSHGFINRGGIYTSAVLPPLGLMTLYFYMLHPNGYQFESKPASIPVTMLIYAPNPLSHAVTPPDLNLRIEHHNHRCKLVSKLSSFNGFTYQNYTA